jgi:hypothetical protein
MRKGVISAKNLLTQYGNLEEPYNKPIKFTNSEPLSVLTDSSSCQETARNAHIYAEQLPISTSGITLIGDNAIVVSPSTLVTNDCTGLAGPASGKVPITQAGICIIGSNIVLQDLAGFYGEHRKVISVGQRVKETYLKGFTVNGFSGLNIAVVGAQNACVTENSVSSGALYGILTVDSKNSDIGQSTILSTPSLYHFYFIGICMDDMSTATTAPHNDISRYFYRSLRADRGCRYP